MNRDCLCCMLSTIDCFSRPNLAEQPWLVRKLDVPTKTVASSESPLDHSISLKKRLSALETSLMVGDRHIQALQHGV